MENERREESQVAGRSGREFDWGWGGVAEGEALRIGQVPVLCSFRAGQGRALRAGAAGALTVELLGAATAAQRRVSLVTARFGFGKTQKMPRTRQFQ